MKLPVSHAITYRVGYAETDQMGVVHHSAYLIWFERARIELLREIGADYTQIERRGVMLPVRDARIRFHHPCRFDDLLEIRATLSEVQPLRCRFHYEVRPAPSAAADASERREDGPILTEAETELVFCDLKGRVIRNGPALLEELIAESRRRADPTE